MSKIIKILLMSIIVLPAVMIYVGAEEDYYIFYAEEGGNELHLEDCIYLEDYGEVERDIIAVEGSMDELRNEGYSICMSCLERMNEEREFYEEENEEEGDEDEEQYLYEDEPEYYDTDEEFQDNKPDVEADYDRSIVVLAFGVIFFLFFSSI